MFSPERIAIVNITNAVPAVVTTQPNHNLTTGQVVRLHVPNGYGMTQINQQQVAITFLSANTFSCQYTQVPVEVNVDSRSYGVFTNVTNPRNTAEVIPMGAGPTPLSSTPSQQRDSPCITKIEDATVNFSTSEIPF